MDKKKVLILLASKHSLPPTKDCSGIAWLIHGVLNEIDGFEITTISPFKSSPVATERINYLAIFTSDNIWTEKLILFCIKSLPNRLRKFLFFSTDPNKILRCVKVAWKARKINADVVISHVYPTLFLLASKLCKKQAKQIYYHHGSLLQELPQNQLQYLSKHCDGLITLSNFALRDSSIKKKYFTFPFRQILNAVDTNSNASRKIITAPLDYGVNENSFSILYAGSIIPGKGVHTLIQTVNELAFDHPNIQLFIVGKIPELKESNYQYFKKLESESKRFPGTVKFTSWISHKELIQLYKFFNISVLLSREQEGNSLFLMESITQGTPVIASRIGGIPDVVDEGLTGFLIDNPENIEEVKSKIRNLIDNKELYQHMRENCLMIGKEKFSYSRAAAELKDFLNFIIQS